MSKMRFYSVGIVAANKLLSSKEVEVSPMEDLTMLDGELDDARVETKAKGKNAEGQAYDTNVKMSNTVRATWLAFGSGNRLTPPDVRRGERVMLFQFADADKFYWIDIMADNRLRKLERVIWAISATKDEAADTDAKHSYYLEMDSHNGLVALHTSQANGEPFGYDLQINAKEGRVVLMDTINNHFLLDSGQQKLHLENAAGSYLDITKQKAKLFTGDSVDIETQTYTLNCQTSTTNSNQTTVNGSSSVLVNGGFVQINGRSNIGLTAPSIKARR